MIKIDSESFDWNTLKEIYSCIAERVIKKYQLYKKNNGNLHLIIAFDQYFGEDEKIQKEKILSFLLFSRITKMKEIIKYFNASSLSCNNTVSYHLVLKLFYLSPKVIVKNVLNILNNQLNIAGTDDWLLFVKNFNSFFANQEENILSKDMKKNFIKTNSEYLDMFEILNWNSNIEQFMSYDMLTIDERHKILKAMNIQTCPYCNRQYISCWELEKNKKVKSTADIDHFFIKSRYPILSLCLYNFIPCCHVCNSRLKLDKDFYINEHIYPYEEEYGENGKFELDTIDYLYGYKPQFSIHISGDDDNERKINNSINTFKINALYRNHEDYISELIRRAQIYTDSQIDELYKKYGGMFKSRKEIETFIFGNYIETKNFIKRPLSKLTTDILEDLGIDL